MAHSSKDISKEVESKLAFIFSNVNEWLKFAEVKNAGLVAFLVAGISGLLSFISSSQQLSDCWKVGIAFAIFFLLISCLFSLSSFIPKVNCLEILHFRKKEEMNELQSDNLIFFGDLAKYKPESLVKKIAEYYFQEKTFEPLKIHTDISAQIIVNSKIALAKFNLFKIALYIIFVAILSLFIVCGIHHLFLSQGVK